MGTVAIVVVAGGAIALIGCVVAICARVARRDAQALYEAILGRRGDPDVPRRPGGRRRP